MLLDTNTLTPAAPVVPTELSAAVACGYILWLMQRAKSLPWITQHTAAVNAIVRAVISGAATLGITFQWNSSAHSLTIENLTSTVIVHGLWHWFWQYAAAHGFEKLLSITPQSADP
jgi:hypothetical protein